LKRNTLIGPQLHQGGAKRFQVSPASAFWLLVPIVIGAGAATQTLAHLLNYHSSLGPNLFHFYPPWSYFVWSYLWRHTNPSIFAQAFGVGVMAAIVSFLFFVLALSRSFRVNPFLHGSARWADERDIKAAGLLNNDGVYVGAWRDKRGTIATSATTDQNISCVTHPRAAAKGSAWWSQPCFRGPKAYL